MITPQEAEEQIAQHLPLFPVMDVPLAAAHGQVLREPLIADRDLPPFDRITMDGIAIHSSAWFKGLRSYLLEGIASAGHRPPALAHPETGCLQVMTGAMLPRGTDTIIPYEELDLDATHAHVKPSANVAPLQFLHSRGSDRHAGETVLQPGCLLNSPRISMAAALGYSTLQVTRRPSVSIISTGDELVEVTEKVEPFQIRSSNDHGIRAALLQRGYMDGEFARVHDDLDATIAVLRDHLARSDALVLTGGVSMGIKDFVPTALEQLGVQCVFHKIRQKPGKPMWFGVNPEGQLVFALPGNTVSALVCTHRYVLPALDRAVGLPAPLSEWVCLTQAVHFRAPLTAFIPVKRTGNGEGLARVQPLETNTSGDWASLADSDGFVQLNDGARVFDTDEPLRYFPWS